MSNLEASVRELGYQLACREIYGENTPAYFELKKHHNNLLQRLKNQINEFSYLTGVDEFIENNSTRQELDNDVKLLLEKIRKDYFND